MAIKPFVPENIVVHLGDPESAAQNVTVSFPDYVKNVASGEIYPTWPENALRANIYAIVTYALNRIYTEWYRSRGYDFDITSVTQYDQTFEPGREVFENIAQLVDALFNSYVVRRGSIEPYFTAFCNGTTSTCAGLSQWGTVTLANQGLTPYEILQYYYGNDIDIVENAPVQINLPSYPGYVLREGSSGNDVRLIQVRLNRISGDFPAIPKISPIDGLYLTSTEDAVRVFQQVFDLPETGEVDMSTWYRIGYLYTSVKKLAELNSEGVALQEVETPFPESVRQGDSGWEIRAVQYYLAVIGQFYPQVPQIEITGYFDLPTEEAVRAFQQIYGLPVTGAVDERTWNDIFRAYDGITENTPFLRPEEGVPIFPGIVLREGMRGEYVRLLQEYLTFIHETYPEIPAVSPTGYFGPVTKSAVVAFQKKFGELVNGNVGALTWNRIGSVYSDLKFGSQKADGQYPGYVIKETR